MGIIGVVAALTIPNLNASTGEAEKVAKVKKNYAVLNEALSRAVVKYGPVRTWFVNDGGDSDKMSKRFADRISEFLKLTKPVEKKDKDSDYYTFTLADGTSVFIYYNDDTGDCFSSQVPAIYLGELDIDIDGDKGKNSDGIDIFDFDITNIGLIPQGIYYSGDLEWDNRWESVPDIGNGYYYGATLWVITHGNMDYLHVDKNLKCKNGKVLSPTVTSCK